MEEIKKYFDETFIVPIIEEKKEEVEEEVVHVGEKWKAETTNFMPKMKQAKTKEEEKIEDVLRVSKREKRVPPVTKKRKNISEYDSMYYEKPFPEDIWREQEKLSESNDPIFEGSVQTCNWNVIRAVRTQNYTLLETLIKSKKWISTLIETWSPEIKWTAVEYAIFNNDIKALEMLIQGDKDHLYWCKKPQNLIEKFDTGELGEYTFSFKVRKVQ